MISSFFSFSLSFPGWTVPKLCPSRSNISKDFQTRPKGSRKRGEESTAWNHNIFEFSKRWSENPRVGSLCVLQRRVNLRCMRSPEAIKITKGDKYSVPRHHWFFNDLKELVTYLTNLFFFGRAPVWGKCGDFCRDENPNWRDGYCGRFSLFLFRVLCWWYL